jgi:hypothetical protein
VTRHAIENQGENSALFYLGYVIDVAMRPGLLRLLQPLLELPARPCFAHFFCSGCFQYDQ